MNATRTAFLLDAFADERDMYARFLRMHGFDVRTFDDAAAALAAAGQHAPDVVIARLRLPNRHVVGIDVARQLKTHPRTQHVPVIIISTSVLDSERDAAFAAGCDSYMLLPCIPQRLLEEVRRVLADAHRRAHARHRPSTLP